MKRGRQGESRQHLLAPGTISVLAQRFQSEPRRAALEPLYDLGRVKCFGGPDQQMEVLRHQDVADELESKFHAQRAQRRDKLLFEAQGIENTRAAVRAAGHKMKMMETIEAAWWHPPILHPRACAGRRHLLRVCATRLKRWRRP